MIILTTSDFVPLHFKNENVKFPPTYIMHFNWGILLYTIDQNISPYQKRTKNLGFFRRHIKMEMSFLHVHIQRT